VNYYLHIGYPKNFSTSLQRSYFSVHPDLYHLGIGNTSNVSYIDDFTSSIFEVYLKSAKTLKYNEVRDDIKHHIQNHIIKAQSSGKKALGVSSEHFSFAFTHETLDFPTKIERFVDLFGNDVKIVMIIREQMGLLKSLYRESIRVGLTQTYNEFLTNLYQFQDRNYFYDLRYDLVYQELRKHFKKENILILKFEEHRDTEGNLVMSTENYSLLNNYLDEFLDISPMPSIIEHHNNRLDDRELVAKHKINKKNKHDLGNELNQTAELHRQSSYFINQLDMDENKHDFYEDVKKKRANLEKAKIEATNFTQSDVDELFKVDKELFKTINSFYKAGNKSLMSAANIDLPECYKG
jgi:hypothetical protein